MAADLERIELFLVAIDLESDIYLFIKLGNAIFDDVTDAKICEETRCLRITSTAVKQPHLTFTC